MDHELKMNAVDTVIRERKTMKVLAEPEQPVVFSDTVKMKHDQMVLESIQIAGWAPFHYARNIGGKAEPWRIHVVKTDLCRKLAQRLPQLVDNMKPSNKIPRLLSACGCLVIVNWLPQSDDSGLESGKLKLVNEEHLCAAAASTQNLLLALTARGLGNYWSSGGSLRETAVFNSLGISLEEKMLAAVFVEYPMEAQSSVEKIPGKQRSVRAEWSAWTTIHE